MNAYAASKSEEDMNGARMIPAASAPVGIEGKAPGPGL